ncbi:hypothetical protein J4232_05875 [Candidatus Woesearchaeota archaeon]|nr:hypothetical protein [Candidatus Woesearchaeota archaeon]
MAKQTIIVRAIIEMLGNPKEHLMETLHGYIDRLKTEKEITVVSEKYEEPILKDELYSTFVELELKVEKLDKLIWFCYDYMPASVEVVEPEELAFQARDVTSFFNEILTKLHTLDMLYKKYKVENELFKKNLTILLRNFIKIELRNAPKTIDELELALGVPQSQITFFLEKLIEEQKIKKEQDKYMII